jgi:hypothetical protein
MRTLSFTAAIVPLLLLGALACVLALPRSSEAAVTAGPVTGWAWSDTIGWIDLNCTNDNSCGVSNYGLAVDSTGTVYGYAWSDAVGWLSANSSDLTGCPSAPCNAQLHHGVVSGWLKALSGDATQGWDGFISLSGSSGGFSWGPLVTNGAFSGYTWGNDVTGWADWSQARTTFDDSCAVTQVWSCQNTQTILETDTSATCVVTTKTSTCNSPQFCSSGSSTCLWPTIQVNPGGNFKANPLLVKQGLPVSLSWSMSNVSACTITGTNGQSWSGSGVGCNGSGTCSSPTGGLTTAAINQQTTFTLACIGLDGVTQSTLQTQTVNIIPTFHEK